MRALSSRSSWALALVGLLARPAAAPARPAVERGDVHAEIARVVQAYGGREALARVHAYRLEGTLFSIRRHDDSRTIRIFERPDRLKVLIGYEDASEVRVIDGAKGWRNESGGPLEPAEGPMNDAMILQAARADVPWILVERESLARFVADTSEDTVSFDGAPAIGIEIPLPGGLTFRAYVDAKTHMVGMSQGLLVHAGFQTHFETYYSSFRTVDGVRFAFEEVNWASGVKTGMTTVKRVILNPPIKPDEFKPPLGPPGSRHDGGN